MLQEHHGRAMDSIHLAQQREKEGPCEQGNKGPERINCGEFLEKLRNSYLLKDFTP